MNFKTTFKLEKPTPSWAISSGREPQYCLVQALVSGYDEYPVKEVGVSTPTSFMHSGHTEISGHLKVPSTSINLDEDFTLIVGHEHVVEHCHFTEVNENSGRFVAAYLYHISPTPEWCEKHGPWRDDGCGTMGICPKCHEEAVAWDRKSREASALRADADSASLEELEAASEILDRVRANPTSRAATLQRERDELQAEVDELKEVQHELRELLAVIHRDGGHYRAEHGDVKATRDAVNVIHRLRREQDELRDRLQFDPGGSDKIDELEQAAQFRQHQFELDHNMLVSIREDLERCLKVLPKERL